MAQKKIIETRRSVLATRERTLYPAKLKRIQKVVDPTATQIEAVRFLHSNTSATIHRERMISSRETKTSEP